MIFTVTLNPALDKTVYIDNFKVNEVNRIHELRQDVGGKGINVSKVIKALGGKSIAYALLGGSTGTTIEGALKSENIEYKSFPVIGETRTNIKVVDEKKHTNTDINEPGPNVSQETLAYVLKDLIDSTSEGDIVVMAGSLPKGAPQDTYQKWCEVLRQKGVHVFLDASGEAMESGVKALPHLIKPNEEELQEIVGKKFKDEKELIAAAQGLVKAGVTNVVISRGSKGAIFVDKKGVSKATSPKIKLESTVGCGDSVVAALAYAEELGLRHIESISLAMATGAASAMQTGTQAPPRELIDSLISQVEFI